MVGAYRELEDTAAVYTKELLRFGREQAPRLDRVRAPHQPHRQAPRERTRRAREIENHERERTSPSERATAPIDPTRRPTELRRPDRPVILCRAGAGARGAAARWPTWASPSR